MRVDPLVTNRLHKLRQEQERLSQALADDPYWLSLCAAGRSNGVDVRLEDLHADAIGDLAENELFSAYVTVTRTIEEMQALEAKALLDVPAEKATDNAQPFRTRVNIKPPAAPKIQGSADRVDDLTEIRNIDRKLARSLNELGVLSYQAIADWDRYEVRRVRDALELGKRIWRENWIEQAALLRMRQLSQPTTTDVRAVEPAQAKPDAALDTALETAPGTTPGSVREPVVAVALPAVLPTAIEAVAGEIAETVKANEALVPAEHAKQDDGALALPGFLTAVGQGKPDAELAEQSYVTEKQPSKVVKVGRRLQRLPAPAARRFAYLSGVSDEMAEALRSAGVKSLADVAAWTRADVKWFRAILGEKAQISRDQWIEQATLLSKGVWTAYALRVVRGETRALVGRPEALHVGGPAMRVEAPPPINLTVPEVEAGADASFDGAAIGGRLSGPSPEIERSHHDGVDVPGPVVPDGAQDHPSGASAEANAAQDDPNGYDVKVAKPDFAPVTVRAKLPPTARFDPMRGLTTAIALSKLKRPPPDLGVDKSKSPPQPIADARPPKSATPSIAAAEIGKDDRLGGGDYPVSSAGATFDAIPPVRLEAPPELCEPPEPIDFADTESLPGAADWDDAEALVVRKKDTSPAVALGHESIGSAEPMAVVALPKADSNMSAEAWNENGDNTRSDAGDDALWGDEADVVIIAKPRKVAGVPMVERPSRPESATERARKRLGIAARTDPGPSRGAATFRDDDRDVQPGSYNDAAEEATVTIIRAEASEESASSIVPSDIANDVARPGPAQQVPKPRVGALGSRFLKALTGD